MKKSEYFRNEYPLEELLPELDEQEVVDIINNHDYTIEANRIAKKDFPDSPMNCVNTADATVFYKMGYEAVKAEIERKLIPILND